MTLPRRFIADFTRTGRLASFGCVTGLAVLVLWTYVTGLHPGVASGDSAELQYTAALGGICHAPGYQTEVTLGGLFLGLPVGGSAAWRLNLLMALCGTIGCLAMYGTVLRISGHPWAATAAGAILAFSVIYWKFSQVAEAYVFYGMFLVLGLYAAVRFVQTDRAHWLYGAMLFLGVAIGDRPSELPVLAGFAALLYHRRMALTLNARRMVLAIVLLALPFAVSVASVIVRSDPHRLANRDDFLQDAILGRSPDRLSIGVDPNAPLVTRIASSVDYCLGLVWAHDASHRFTLATGWQSFKKFLWLHSGAGAWGVGLYPGKEPYPDPGGGTSIGPLGLLLAITATIMWRRRLEWLLVGWGLVLANLLFIVLYPRWDNLTFTVPSAVGWSLLVGLGAAGCPEAGQGPVWKLARGTLALAAPVFLLATNGPHADPQVELDLTTNMTRIGTSQSTTPMPRSEVLQRRAAFAAAPWPQQSALLENYWSAMTLRYVLYVETARSDIHVLHSDRRSWPAIIQALTGAGHPVFIPAQYVAPDELRASLRYTPPALARLSYFRVVAVPRD